MKALRILVVSAVTTIATEEETDDGKENSDTPQCNSVVLVVVAVALIMLLVLPVELEFGQGW